MIYCPTVDLLEFLVMRLACCTLSTFKSSTLLTVVLLLELLYDCISTLDALVRTPRYRSGYRRDLFRDGRESAGKKPAVLKVARATGAADSGNLMDFFL